MVIRRQERIYKEIDVSRKEFDENFKKFAIICLTISILFHELGHAIMNLIFGFEIYGFYVLGFCFDKDIGFSFDVQDSLTTGLIVKYRIDEFYKIKTIIALISGFIFQFILTFLLLRFLKINFPFMNSILFLCCFGGSLGDFYEIAKLFIV